MVIFITGPTHTGKTLLAQGLLEKYYISYLSLDHLKMGMIRSEKMKLDPDDDEKITEYLWPIVVGIAKTVIENHQNIIIEGESVPFDWKKSFSIPELTDIVYICLVMSEEYIINHCGEIVAHANDIEYRGKYADIPSAILIQKNKKTLIRCREENLPYIYIDSSYDVFDKAEEQIEKRKWNENEELFMRN